MPKSSLDVREHRSTGVEALEHVSTDELALASNVRKGIEVLVAEDGLSEVRRQVAGGYSVMSEDVGAGLDPAKTGGRLGAREMAFVVALGGVLPGCDWKEVVCGGLAIGLGLAMIAILIVKYARPMGEAMLRATGGIRIPAGHMVLREPAFGMVSSGATADARVARLEQINGPTWIWQITKKVAEIRPGEPVENQIVKPVIDTLPREGDFEEIFPINGVTAKVNWSVTRELIDLRRSVVNMGANTSEQAIETKFLNLAKDASLKAITNLFSTSGLTIEELNARIRDVNAALQNEPELTTFEQQYGWRLTIQLAAIENDPAVQKQWDAARAAAAGVPRAQAEAQTAREKAMGERDAQVLRAQGAQEVARALGPDAGNMVLIAGMDPAVAGPMATAMGYAAAGRGFGEGFGRGVGAAIKAVRDKPAIDDDDAPTNPDIRIP